MLSNHAIIILYKGKDVTEDEIKKMVSILADKHIAIPEMVTVTYKDQNGIVSSLLRDTILDDGEVLIHEDEPTSHKEACRNAIIYIGERFKRSLTCQPESTTTFAIELSSEMANKENISLINAVEVISSPDFICPTKLAKNYHITADVINAIRYVAQIYNQG